MEIIICNDYSKILYDQTIFVYVGFHKGIKTKWITQSKWDYTLTSKLEKNDLIYLDSKGQQLFCYKRSEYEYSLF